MMHPGSGNPSLSHSANVSNITSTSLFNPPMNAKRAKTLWPEAPTRTLEPDQIRLGPLSIAHHESVA